MDRTTIIGIISGCLAVGVGLILKDVSLLSLFNPAAIVIIFVGTAASVLIAFPTSTIQKIPQLFVILFKDDQDNNVELINTFTYWAEMTRKEGLLWLEEEIDKTSDPFLSSALQLVIDGQSNDLIRDVLIEKIRAMEERHREGASVFTQAGTYAPTLGVLGAVVGLIAALGSMEEMDVLGEAISAAFMATLFGIFSGYVLWHPFANKLKEKSKKEIHSKYIIIEGVLSLAAGESPQMIKDKLSSYLSSTEIHLLNEELNNA